MKKSVIYAVTVRTDHNGQRIIAKHTKTHVQRIGVYTPRIKGEKP